jgi:small subunit ribosomal protein S1
MAASTQVEAATPPSQEELLTEEDVDAMAAGITERKFIETGSDVLEETTSRSEARSDTEHPWRDARAHFDDDLVLEAVVVGYNKGGLLVEWRGLQGFVPASQLLGLTQLHVEEERLRQLEQRQGKTLALKIIEVNEESNRLILSERATEVSASERENLLETLETGEICTGVVTNLASFGAFVDLGGVEGLIHISQLSWRRLTHPSDVVKPGEKVRVLVLEVDADRGRVALSRKQLLTDPWIDVEKRYRSGQTVSGKVTNHVDFGAFVLLEEGLEGLVHVSEMGEMAPEVRERIFAKGATVTARVLSVSEKDRRLALSVQGMEQAGA